jgi:glucosamine--fructose-6-phosphate aminotransferase (isomerizing)
MCGITAILLHSHSNESIYPLLLDSLQSLLNRGYDSVGVSVIDNDQIETHKYASTHSSNAISILENKIQNIEDKNLKIGIGHTRWATHGGKTNNNSHPHSSFHNLFSLVHNGIIENYQILKNKLLKEGYTFRSETDSEVIVNLIEYHFVHSSKSIQDAIYQTVRELEGTYGIVLICKNEPQRIYCIKNGSPLLIGIQEDQIGMIVSESSAFCGRVNTYITLQNDDLCILEEDDKKKIKMITQHFYSYSTLQKNDVQRRPDPYPHWTLKEIYDQPFSILNALNHGGRIQNGEVKLGGLDAHIDYIKNIEHIILLGMGTSYHAGMIGEKIIKNMCDFQSVRCYDAGEFHEDDIPLKNTLAILISQSGETKDLHACLKILKQKEVITMGIINVVDSLIAREVDFGVYTNSGKEIAVASTKVFTSQVIVLHLISIWLSQFQNTHLLKRKEMIKDLQNISYQLDNLLHETSFIKSIQEWVQLFIQHDYQHLFLLGKGIMYPIAEEGSLKIKEITYLHSEAYSSSSLKHGPFSLLHSHFPVMILDCDDEHHSKNMNTMEEILARDAPLFIITSLDLPDRSNVHLIKIPFNKNFQILLMIVTIQLFAYYLAVEKGTDCDKPRNLAKTVTTF